jgi:hypothetical protein
MAEHFIGVEIGTGSARAGVFDPAGTMLASANRYTPLARGPRHSGAVQQRYLALSVQQRLRGMDFGDPAKPPNKVDRDWPPWRLRETVAAMPALGRGTVFVSSGPSYSLRLNCCGMMRVGIRVTKGLC